MSLIGLHPRFAGLILRLINLCKDNGLIVGIVSGYRSFEDQDVLFRKVPKVTNAKGGFSWHNYGLATDLAFKDAKGNISWSDSNPWDKLGELGKSIGLEWGGDFKSLKDRPHFQFTNGLNIREALRTYQQSGLAGVWLKVFPTS